MLTPKFEINQDDGFVFIEIHAPFANISETEIFILDSEFKFYSKPYYLRLTLPGRITEDGREKAKYDCEKGTFKVTVPKETKGEHFEGLDMLTKLLAPSGQTSAKGPMIEVLDESKNDTENKEVSEEEEEEEFDWQIEQEPYVEEERQLLVEQPKYGFGNSRTGVFARLQEELTDLIDLKNADKTPMSERRQKRLKDEQAKFDEDHYLADLYQDEAIDHLLQYKPYWYDDYKKIKSGAKEKDLVKMTEKEKEKMLKLPRKEYLLDDKISQSVYLGLVDIMFAYVYNHRTTEGESTVESGWTICKLAGTLSWLENYTSLKDVIVACYRRALCFPLYRHWDLLRCAHRDVKKLFTIGKRQLLKCLLDVHSILSEGESRYILNDLYITDYCVWIQSASEKQLQSLARRLTDLEISKEDVEFDLVELEQAAEMVIEEEGQATVVTEQLSNLTVSKTNADPITDISSQLTKTNISEAEHNENKTIKLVSDCDKVPLKSSEKERKIVELQDDDSDTVDSDDSSSDNEESTGSEESSSESEEETFESERNGTHTIGKSKANNISECKAKEKLIQEIEDDSEETNSKQDVSDQKS